MDESEETLCKYGTPLPAYEEDEIPSKKPVSVEDQIVLDVNGKRRFHGAFTGGFSAGYWNTVGSEKGWTPSQFKSSRNEKASARAAQNPMDFMDEEDLGEFGIAPQRVQTKDDFAQSSKATKRRMAQASWSGPIPGQPVLKALLEPAKEKTAVKILKKMGWREGQGIGERQSRAEKKKAKDRNKKELYVMKMYGCELPGRSEERPVEIEDTESESDMSDYEVSFAPDDFDPLVAAIKDNTFGLGYSGLDRGSISGQKFNLFDTLEIVDRNNKKLSIRGQAFGVGALEDDDDEDVYSKDDMSRYDFSLEDKAKAPAAIKSAEHAGCLDGFCPAKKSGKHAKKVFRVKIPDNFTPRNWLQRRSRFEPLDEGKSQQLFEDKEYKIKGLGRHDLDPQSRGQALGEKPLAEKKTPSNPVLDMISKRSESFVSGEVMNSEEPHSSQIVQPETSQALKSNAGGIGAKLETTNLGSTKEGFKPFIMDPDKQERYEKFLSFKPSDKYKTKEEFLSSLQPLGMSSWDQEREFKEFAQAQRMYRPLDGLMSDRFVTESNLIKEKESTDVAKSAEIKMKRTRVMWKPHKELCKRFNVPEPFGGMLEEEKVKSKTKFSVFDYLEAPANSKTDFITPVVIPKRSAPSTSTAADSKTVRASAKDFFSKDDQPKATTIASHSEPVSQKSTLQNIPPIVAKKPEKRSELEQKVIESVNKKPEEKKDLFKSIFCSSDEEDEENSQEASNSEQASDGRSMNESEKLKLVESMVAIKPASQLNVLRNDSPPRGIFKSILEINKSIKEPDSRITDKQESEDSSSSSEDETQDDEQFYGPKLPTKGPAVVTPSSTAASQLDAQLVTMMQKTGSRLIVEEWVEKEKSSSKKGKKKKHKEHKKSKKHKKEKKKHKHNSK